MKHVKLMLILSMALFIVLYSLPVEKESSNITYELDEKPIQNRRVLASYENRTSIINVTGDTEFETQAGEESWPGQGTWDNPYRIENFNITNSSTCIIIRNVSIHFVIRGCLLTTNVQGSGDGISLDNVTHCYIEDCIILRKDTGIDLNDCRDVVIDNCVLTDHWTSMMAYNAFNTTMMNCELSNPYGQDGVYFSNSDNCTLYNNSLTDLSGEMGAISFDESDFVNITENDISGNWNGIYLMNCDDAVIFNNTINWNGYEGVGLDNCERCTIELNEIKYNQALVTGVHVEYSPHLLIVDNDISYNYKGVWISNSEYCNLTNNDIQSNHNDGVEISNSHTCTLHNNTITDNDWYGVELTLSNSTRFTNNTIAESWYDGIYVDRSEDCTFYNNTLYSNSEWMGVPACSIELNSAHRSILIDNVIHDDYENGIGIHSSDNCSLIRNQIYSNGYQGVYAEFSWNVTLIDNDIFDNDGSGVFLSDCENCTLDINRVYDNSENGIGLSGEGGSPNVTITNNVIYENGDRGIYLWNSDNCTISVNEIFNNTDCGIYVFFSESCQIIDNEIHDNGWKEMYWYASGIYIIDSDYCYLERNLIYNNSQHGIYLGGRGGSERCTIFNNTIYSNWGLFGEFRACGICIDYSNWCNVTLNKIYNNTYDGIYVYGSLNCYFANNTIFNNTEFGIYSEYSNYTCEYNVIYNNGEDGLYVGYDQGYRIVIYRNIIYDNGGYGIYLTEVYNAEIYHNDVGWNSIENAYHSAEGGFNWDDGEGIGNWWSDYDWSGVYDISGVGSQDRYPSISLACGNSTNLEYELDETGNTMTWNATALHPWKYEAWRNITLIDSGAWTGADITIDVDGTPVGHWNITLVVYHISGHFCKNSSLLTVFDDPPSFDPVEDQTIEFIFESLSYDIDAYDPSSVHKFWLNGTPGFHIDVDGLLTNTTTLAVGEYWLEVWANDTNGNEDYIILKITVEDTTDPQWVEEPTDQYFEYTFDFSYALYATDESEIVDWWISDQTNFHIDGNGLITNNTFLDIGTYPLTVRVTDEYGNDLEDTFSVFVDDTTPPDIEGPDDFSYTVGTTGHEIIWTLGDHHPYLYRIIGNGSTRGYTAWSNGPLDPLSIDGYYPGVYNHTIEVHDLYSNKATHTVLVTVTAEGIAPDLDAPDDIEYELGSTGHNITWNVGDINPGQYNITGNIIHIGPYDWENGTIIVYIDGLDVGVYNYTIILLDLFENKATDTVFVEVIDTTPPTWEHDLTNQEIKIGEELSYDLNATDLSPLDTWWLSNTASFFNITQEGIVHLAGVPSGGTFILVVNVNDIYGNTLTDEFNVTIVDNIDPVWNPEPVDQVVEYGTSFSYELDATDHSLISSWQINDTNFIIDGNGMITNSTTLALGEYGLEVRVYDEFNNYASSKFKVTVRDTTPPMFDITPNDIVAEVGDTISITWCVFDLCPESYDVLLNGTSINSGIWNITSANISVTLDGLAVGSYNVTILIEDSSGNAATDEIIIAITEPEVTTTTTTTANTTTTTTTPGVLDPGTVLTLTVAGVGGAIAVVIVVIVVAKKRTSG